MSLFSIITQTPIGISLKLSTDLRDHTHKSTTQLYLIARSPTQLCYHLLDKKNKLEIHLPHGNHFELISSDSRRCYSGSGKTNSVIMYSAFQQNGNFHVNFFLMTLDLFQIHLIC